MNPTSSTVVRTRTELDPQAILPNVLGSKLSAQVLVPNGAKLLDSVQLDGMRFVAQVLLFDNKLHLSLVARNGERLTWSFSPGSGERKLPTLSIAGVTIQPFRHPGGIVLELGRAGYFRWFNSTGYVSLLTDPDCDKTVAVLHSSVDFPRGILLKTLELAQAGSTA